MSRTVLIVATTQLRRVVPSQTASGSPTSTATATATNVTISRSMESDQ
jgi:hypothetical protein